MSEPIKPFNPNSSKNNFVKAALACLFVVFIAGISFLVLDMNSSSTSTVAFKPNNVKITNVFTDRFSVTWETKTKQLGQVKYGKGSDLTTIEVDDRDQLNGDNKQYFTHHVTISKLTPETKYSFVILGDNGVKYDKEFSITTAPKIDTEPESALINGVVQGQQSDVVTDALVFVSVGESSVLSTPVKSDGSWLINLANLRSSDDKTLIVVNPETKLDISASDSKLKSSVSVAFKEAVPVSPLTLGKESLSDTGSKESTKSGSTQSGGADTFKQPEVFIQEVGSTGVVLEYPSVDNEEIGDVRPVIKGSGPSGVVLTIKIIAIDTVRGVAIVDSEGKWQYTPSQDLQAGTYTLNVDYIDENKSPQQVTRKFVVNPSAVKAVVTNNSITTTTTNLGNVPSIEASPSGQNTGSVTPVVTSSATSSANTGSGYVPDTSGGVPVSGSTENTFVLLWLGSLLIAGGLYVKANKQIS